MSTPLEKNVLRNSIVLAILFFIVAFSMLAFLPFYALKIIFAAIMFITSIVLPIRQKRFSVYSLLLVIIGILFLLSGVVENPAANFLNSLPISSQIEFSKILHPREVSTGLWSVGLGIINVMFIWRQWTSFKNRSQQPQKLIWWFRVAGVLSILFIILGVSSIIYGLSRL